MDVDIWSLDFSKKLNLNENEWVEILEEKVNKSVKDRMISDVPVGAFLSGGVDSSATTAFMAMNSTKRIKTFSVGFTDPKFDETKYSKQIAELYCTDHSFIKIDAKTFKEELPKISDYYDEPFADNSLIPTLFLSRFVRKDVTVALSGDGGDENFAGYDRYSVVAFGEYFRLLPRKLRNYLVKPVISSLFNLSPNLLTSRLKTFSDTFEEPFYKRYMNYKSFFNNDYKDFILSNSGKDTFLIDKEQFDNKLTDIDNALKADINSYLPEDLLYKMDIASMSASLEVRAPLLDYQLMELTAKIPSYLKIRNFNKKYIFKRMLLEKNILPENIVNRPKMGFNAPIGDWLQTDLKEYTLSQLNSKKFRQSGIFDDSKLDSYINEYYSSDLGYHNNIFALLTLSNWINKFF